MPKEMTVEEQEIYRRLHEKVEKLRRVENERELGKEKKEEGDSHSWYKSNMKSLRELLGMSS